MNMVLSSIKKILLVYTVLLFLLSPLLSQDDNRIESIQKDLKFLASEECEGRLAGSKGNKLAEEYILNRFKEIKLLPVGGQYLQSFTINTGLTYGPNNLFTATKLVEKSGLPKEMWTKARKKMIITSDYQPLSISANGSVEGEVAFVGYGITAKELNYDDYEGIEVKDKIVIIISDSADGKPLDSRFASYSTLKYKAHNAKEHGAAGIVFIKRISDSANTFYPLTLERFSGNSGLPIIQANRTELAKYFPKENNLYPTEISIINTKKPKSFILPNVSFSFSVDLRYEETEVSNVMGMIRGIDKTKSDEYIIIGAHYDHIGWGAFNSSYKGKPTIHYGADDNASGVSALIDLATHIARQPLRRSVIFIAFNAEEMGLLGSAHFVKNSPVDLSKIITMINLDMVGRMQSNNLTVFGSGSGDTFDEVLNAVAEQYQINISKNNEGYGPSDHTSFYIENIPVLFFFTGAHSDYHSPGDTYEKINFNGIVTISEMIMTILKNIDSRNEAPKFIQSSNSSNPNNGKGRSDIKVSFGSIPDFSGSTDGFLINGCKQGSPCENAGLKKGDTIVSFANMPINNLSEFTEALKKVNPGDIVNIEYLRAGKRITTKVELQAK